MDAVMPMERQKNREKVSHSAAGEILGRVITWTGLVVVGILAVPTGLLFVLIFAVRSFVDWTVSRLSKKANVEIIKAKPKRGRNTGSGGL